MEAQSYYSSHIERKYKKSKIGLEDAREKINSNVDIYYEGLALIPTDWKTEILTYEFKGRVNENDFIVYINAETGREEKIFMIVNTPNGILTV
jgi:germination protein YpeB